MRILLVTPTWTDDLGIFAKLAKKRNSQPALGILYLAAVAEKRGHDVRVIDADVEGYTIDSLAAEIINSNYDMVGITATSPIFHKAVSLAKMLKSEGYKNPILIGGEHINIFKGEAFLDCFDFAFVGESDFSFNDFLGHYESNSKDFHSVKGLIFRKDGKVVINEAGSRIDNLDELEFPAMHLLKRNSYIMTFAKFSSREYLPIMATRGCPFKCVFCSEPLTNPIVRYRSPENIADEMEKWVKELGITHFFFLDSNITLKRQQIEGICRELLKRKLKVTWEGWTRANLVDRPLLTLMKEAGLIRISYGIESGDPEILRIIKKKVSHDDMLNAFKITEELGIEPACSLMIGLPGETRASAERTIEFARNIPQILYSNLSIANPYPGTELYDWAVEGKYGIKLHINDHSEYRRYDSSPISVNDLSQEDLVRLQKIGLLKIHLTPKRIIVAVKMLGFWNLIPVFISFITAGIRDVFFKSITKSGLSTEVKQSK
ncbi:MAG: radical SAM protein [Nitrospirota bacterium]